MNKDEDIIWLIVMDIGWLIFWIAGLVIAIRKRDKEKLTDALMSLFITPVAFIPVCMLLVILFFILLFEGLPNLILWATHKTMNQT